MLYVLVTSAAAGNNTVGQVVRFLVGSGYDLSDIRSPGQFADEGAMLHAAVWDYILAPRIFAQPSAYNCNRTCAYVISTLTVHIERGRRGPRHRTGCIRVLPGNNMRGGSDLEPRALHSLDRVIREYMMCCAFQEGVGTVFVLVKISIDSLAGGLRTTPPVLRLYSTAGMRRMLLGMTGQSVVVRIA